MKSLKQPFATFTNIGYLTLGVIVLISAFKPVMGVALPLAIAIAYLLAQAVLTVGSGMFHATFDSYWRHWDERGMYAVFNVHLAILLWQTSGSVWVPIIMAVFLSMYMGYLFYDLSSFVILPIMVLLIFFVRWAEGMSLWFMLIFIGAVLIAGTGWLFESEADEEEEAGNESKAKKFRIIADLIHGVWHPATQVAMYFLLIQ